MRALNLQRRTGRRRERPRPLTVPLKKLTKQAIRVGRIAYPEEVTDRPQTRADCTAVPRPCPYVGCKYNLFLDVNRETGSIKFNFPDIEPWEMKESCALDVTDEVGELVLEDVGEVMNLTRERIRQIEDSFLEKMRKDSGLAEFT